MPIDVFTDNAIDRQTVSDVFRRHNIAVNWHIASSDNSESVTQLLSNNNPTIKLVNNIDAGFELSFLKTGRKLKKYTTTSDRGAEELVSRYILDFHKFAPSDLTCRPDSGMLTKYINPDGSVCFSANPKEWLESNSLFKILDLTLYDRLLNFTLNERGMFPKVWSYKNQKNYWNSTFNGGLPIIKKRDEIHEGTFMLHDLWHFVFRDPVINGTENKQEQRVFIANRLMSEAFTLVLTDMVGVSHANLDKANYDTSKRKIFPILSDSKLSSDDLNSVKTLLWANAQFAILGNTKPYEEIVKEPSILREFKTKYSIFFSVDLQWNFKNVQNQINQIKANENLRQYSNSFLTNTHQITTAELCKLVKVNEEQISFSKLFNFFWSQLLEVLHYDQRFNHVEYFKIGVQKYIDGQMFLYYKNKSFGGAGLDKVYATTIEKIQKSSKISELESVYKSFRTSYREFLNELEAKGVILPDEASTYMLHAPHFPPIYLGYDNPRDQYPKLEDVSTSIFKNTLLCDSIKVTEEVKNEDQSLYRSALKKRSVGMPTDLSGESFTS